MRERAHLARALQRRRPSGQPVLPDPVRERRHGRERAADGLSTTAFPTNSGAGSVEALESIAPLLVWKKEFRRDSGGAGRFRGGLGQEIEVEVTSPEPLRLSLLSDRRSTRRAGSTAASDGTTVEIFLRDGTRPHPKSRSSIKPGDRLIMRFAGGGGYGDPRERDHEAVQEDIRAGYMSAEAARRDYGIEPA